MTDSQSGAAASQRIGVLLALGGMLMFALNDVLGKWMVASYPVGQVVLVRSLTALLVLGPLIWRARPKLFPVERPRMQVGRVVSSTMEVFCFYSAVAFLPLADVMTYWLAAPIYVAALSPLMLGERVGAWRWGAILVGFAGVLVAMRPGTVPLSPAVLVSLAGSLAFAYMILSARALRHTPDLGLVLWQTLGAAAAGVALTPFGWVTPPLSDLVLLGLLGIMAMTAHLAVARSLKFADAATVAPIQYTLIVYAVIFGWLVFGDVAATAIIVGAGLVVASGLVIWFRETRARRRI